MSTSDDIRMVEQLLQTLDENPRLMEALRSRILTRELLELPEKLASLTERVEQLAAQIDRLAEQQEQTNQRLDRMDQRLDRMDQRFEQVDQRFEQVDQRFEQIDQRFEQVDQRFERMDRRLDRIVDDLGHLKDVGTITATRAQAHVIAMSVGLRSQRELAGNEIIDLCRNQDTADLQPGDLMSFYRADLIMAATDDAGDWHYIAVEASFTADERDTRRAIRNAGYLTRFTGLPAHAVVAATRIDRQIQPVLDSGQVVWYHLANDADG